MLKRLPIRKSDALLLVLLLVGAAIAATITVTTQDSGSRLFQPRSTFHVEEGGVRAMYLVFDRLGYDVSQYRRAINRTTLEQHDALVLLDPIVHPTDPEKRDLLEWVRSGGRLLITPGRSGFNDWFNVVPRWKREANASSDEDRADAAPPADEDVDEDDEVVRRAMRGEGPFSGPPRWAHRGEGLVESDPLVGGVTQLETRVGSRFDADNPTGELLESGRVEAFWTDRDGVVGMRVRIGAGVMIVLGDSYPLTNIGIGKVDNALFAANVALELTDEIGAGSVAFDEYHQGYAHRDHPTVAILRLLIAEGRGWGFAQAAAAALLAIFASAVRFGRPRDLVVRERRQQGEFVEAAGRLLDDAGGTAVAWETLYTHYRRHLCKLVHRDDRITDEELALAVKQQVGEDISSVLSRPTGRRMSRDNLLHRSQSLNRAVEMLEHAD